jgi:hypothetical protein
MLGVDAFLTAAQASVLASAVEFGDDFFHGTSGGASVDCGHPTG